MTRDFNNIIVVDNDTEVYKNADEYFKSKNLNRPSQYRKCFKTLINDIGFDKCKRILLEYVYPAELLLDYRQDKNFNLSKLQRMSSREYFTNLCTDARPNKWDEIGHRMLRANRKLYIKYFSLCDLTSLAKACARMIVDNYKKGQKI